MRRDKKLSKIVVAIWCLWFAPHVSSQVNSAGSVVVVRRHRDKITVAADTRSTDATTHRYRDDDCKIENLGDKFFFASSGQRHFEITLPEYRLNWDSHDIARQAFNSSPKDISGSRDVSKVVTNWNRIAEKLFNPIPPILRNEVATRTNIKQVGPKVLFVGSEGSTGDIAAYLDEIWYINNKFLGRKTLVPIDKVLATATGQSSAVGSLLREFAQGLSRRSRFEIQRWKLTTRFKSPDEVDSDWIVKLVDWMIAYSTDPTIGGHTEAMELRASGTVRWIRPCQ